MARVASAAVLIALLCPRGGGAQSLVTPRVGGSVFSGPAEPHVTAVYWNPAAIGALRGFHLYANGALRIDRGVVDRDAIDATTGRPAAEATPADAVREIPSANTSALTPDFFAGVTWDFESKSMVGGLAVYAPFVERLGDDPDWSGRYFRTDLTWYHLYVSPAVAFRIGGGHYVGVAPNLIFGWLRFALARDAALDGGSRAGRLFEERDLREDIAVEVHGRSLGFSVGWLYRAASRLDIGAAWITRPVREGSSLLRAGGTATVGGPLHGGPTLVGRAGARWALPDQVLAGVDLRPLGGWRFGLWGRWTRWSVHEDLRLQLSSQSFEEADPAVPGQLTAYRGFHDTFALQGTAGHRVTDHVGLLVSILLETAAVAESSVNPAQVDGPHLDAVLAAEWAVHEGLTLHVGYGALVMRDRDAAESDFDPQAAVSCVDAGYDVDNPGCALLEQGRALPTARGTYKRIVHRVDVGVAWE